MLQPNLGTTIVIATITFSVLFVAGVRMAPLLGWGALGTVAALGAAMGESYRRARLTAFLNPWNDPQNTGYQTIQSLVALASGGWFGLGLGQSRAKWGFLPYAYTDFIFAIIAEELGFFGALLVVALFVALAFLGVRAGLQAPDPFGRLLAIGITTWLSCRPSSTSVRSSVCSPSRGCRFHSSPSVARRCSPRWRRPASCSTWLGAAAIASLFGVAEPASPTFAIIAGGGTAGHVLPGLAVAEALVARGHDRSSIHYVGSEGRIEARLVPEAGFALTLLTGAASSAGSRCAISCDRRHHPRVRARLRARAPAPPACGGRGRRLRVRRGRVGRRGVARADRRCGAERRTGRGQPARREVREGVRRLLRRHAPAASGRDRKPDPLGSPRHRSWSRW